MCRGNACPQFCFSSACPQFCLATKCEMPGQALLEIPMVQSIDGRVPVLQFLSPDLRPCNRHGVQVRLGATSLLRAMRSFMPFMNQETLLTGMPRRPRLELPMPRIIEWVSACPPWCPPCPPWCPDPFATTGSRRITGWTPSRRPSAAALVSWLASPADTSCRSA